MDNFRTSTGSGGNTVVETTLTCGGFTWNTGNCAVSGVGIELNAASSAIVCNASTDQYVLRPKIGNANWGGINGATVGAPTQTMSVSYTTAATDSLTVTNTNDSGAGSLRDAITYANANAVEDNITFDIPGAGPHTIALSSDLPTISDDGISIDGTTQSGAFCGQLTTGTQHTLKIQIDGTSASNEAFSVTGDNVTIMGLSIYGFPRLAIEQQSLATTTLADCLYLGLHADGTTLSPNATDPTYNPNVLATGASFTFNNSVLAAADADAADKGINLTSVSGASITGNLIGLKADGLTDGSISREAINITGTSTNVTIGGATPATRNVIANAGAQGIKANASGTVTIIGNFLGTDRTGLVAKGNRNEAIRVADGTVTIGGTDSGEGNVISGTTNDDGIYIVNASPTVTILGNLIGVAADGTTPMGNSSSGIDVGSNASSVYIGDGTAVGLNVIANNGDDGVELTTTSYAAVVGNNIYNNTNMAIELVSGALHNANDISDVDTGGNDLLNYPVFSSVGANGTTTVSYDITLDVPADADGYRIDFFLNSAVDSTGSGEGETHLGNIDVAHSGGATNFVGNFSANTTVDVGDLIAATTTRKTGASSYDITSEFSLNEVAVTAIDPLVVTNTNDSGEGSLRDVITFANTNTTSDAITFAISGAGPHVISPLTALPTITDDNVSIDGTSQSGTVCNTLVNGTPHILNIQIDGASSTDAEGLYVNADNVALSGLSITGFDSRAIRISGPSNNASVDCSYLGVNPDGTTKNGNARGDSVGSVLVLAGDGATVTRSVVSGNDDDSGDVGVYISGESAVLTGNIIGLTADGSTALGNGNYGFNIRPEATNTTIGGVLSSDRNIISGNGGSGLYITGTTTVTILGNYIGTDVTGLIDRGNGNSGITADSSTNGLTVGGTTAGARNVISGNGDDGIYLVGATNISILGNYIGLGADGSTLARNTVHAINANSINGLAIGNGLATGRNVLVGTSIGLNLTGTSTNVSINDNYLNTDSSGNIPTLSGLDGIVINGPVTTLDILNNVIGQVDQDKIEFWGSSAATSVTIQGNNIGVGADGTTDISGGVGLVGVRIWAGYTVTGLALDGNMIANSGDSGVYFDSSVIGVLTGNIIEANGSAGVEVINAGAAVAIYQNSIFGNTGLGIDIGTSDVTENDTNDVDTGPNALLNFPVIKSASGDGTTIFYDFDLDTISNLDGYRIDFYLNSAGDPLNHGEGETHLGFIDIAHAGGNLNFSGSFTGTQAIDESAVISATATRKTGASSYDVTSEFSLNYNSDAATELTASKSVDVFDPTSAGLYALPGNDIISSMTVTNVGNSAADTDTIVVIDAVPSEMTFYNGDMDEGGPATQPIYFTQTGGANLTFTYAADAAFSNSPSRPANMAGCTYTPSAGYDSNVTYVCFNPKGAMASGDPDPTFTVQFRARIK